MLRENPALYDNLDLRYRYLTSQPLPRPILKPAHRCLREVIVSAVIQSLLFPAGWSEERPTQGRILLIII